MMSNEVTRNSEEVGDEKLSAGTVAVGSKEVKGNENVGSDSMTLLGKQKNMDERVEVCRCVIIFLPKLFISDYNQRMSALPMFTSQNRRHKKSKSAKKNNSLKWLV